MAVEEIEARLEGKLEELQTLLGGLGRIAIGFSGGVDSTFLAAVCARCAPERTLLIHAATPFSPSPEKCEYERACERLGLPVLALNVDPLSSPAVASNPADRCYHCKRFLFERICEAARERGCDTVLEGSNADDAHDFRPGMQAIRELEVRSPLMETGWSKAEERALLRTWGHSVWNLPAGACLATRVACGERISREKLEVVRACEDYLHGLGLKQVRARISHGSIQIAASPDDLDALRKRSAPETDVVPDSAGAVRLPRSIIEGLLGCGANSVEATALPYRSGGEHPNSRGSAPTAL